MSKKLKSVFEYQRFEQNPELEEMIADTESRYGISELSEDELDMVVAAGETRFHRELPKITAPVILSTMITGDFDEKNKK